MQVKQSICAKEICFQTILKEPVMFARTISDIPVSSIIIADRQRSVLTPDSVERLALSIAAIGLNIPIQIHQKVEYEPVSGKRLSESFQLIAGEHRIRAFQYLVQNSIPCTFDRYKDWTVIPAFTVRNIDPLSLQMLELIENTVRTDLTWQDTCIATWKLIELYLKEKPTATTQEMAEYIGIKHRQAHIFRTLGPCMNDKNFSGCDTITSAFNKLTAEGNRIKEHQKAQLSKAFVEEDVIIPEEVEPEENLVPVVSNSSVEEKTCKAEDGNGIPFFQIFNTSFEEFVKTYDGTPFNCIHCDFPYGINLQKTGQVSGKLYNDSPELFTFLTDTLIVNLPKLLAPHGFILFWLTPSMIQTVTEKFQAAGCFVDAPWVWVKSDNTGILPDQQLPRRCVEFCLLIKQGKPTLRKPGVNFVIASSTARKRWHPSEKPREMLEIFLGMLVGPDDTLFDPTCGSGTSVQTAFRLGCAEAIGLELDPEFAQKAQEDLFVQLQKGE